MHRCLQIPELVLRIVEDLHPHYREPPADYWDSRLHKEDATVVAQLARVSRIFLEPALDVLWHTQHDILPLLALLNTPSCTIGLGELWLESPKPIEVGADLMEWCTQHGQVLASAHWRRLEYYAARVHNIVVGGGFHYVRFQAGPEIIVTTLETLVTLKRGPLFPHLRYLDIREIFDRSNLPPSIFSSVARSEALQSLSVSLSLDDRDEAFRASLLSFVKASPSFQSLWLTLASFKSSRENPSTIDAALKYLSALSAVLRTRAHFVDCKIKVDCYKMPYLDLLPTLASWPKLAWLHFSGYDPSNDEGTGQGFQIARPPHVFSNLRELVLDLKTSTAVSILQSSSFPVIRRLNFHDVNRDLSSPELQQLL